MGLFDFVENFFFISLGITFALILLLVYHFKQRISSMERKGDTMFELLSNVVKELQSVKGINSYYESFFQSREVSPNVCPYSPPQKTTEPPQTPETHETIEEPEKRIIDLSLENSCPFVSNMNVVKQPDAKIVVSDDDDSDSESEYSESEGSCLDDSDSDSDSSSVYDEDIESLVVESTPVIESTHVIESTPVIEPEVVVLEPIVLESSVLEYSGLESSGLEYSGLDSSVLEPVSFESEVQPEQVPLTEFEIEQISVVESHTSVEEQGTSTQETSTQETSTQETSTQGTSIQSPEQTSEDAIKNQKHEVYLKMNITQLKTLAISVGIQQDISKMKKKDLIRLLESLDE